MKLKPPVDGSMWLLMSESLRFNRFIQKHSIWPCQWVNLWIIFVNWFVQIADYKFTKLLTNSYSEYAPQDMCDYTTEYSKLNGRMHVLNSLLYR